MLTVEQICWIYEQHGHRSYYGESVSHLQHALQAATLAEQSGASPQMVCAALLHDFGHLAMPRSRTAINPDHRTSHEKRALPLLEPLFRAEILEPIRMHVDAKRYLCAVDFDYLLRLTPRARYRLHTYGGVFTFDEAAQFIKQAYAPAALELCRWDDHANVGNKKTRSLCHFEPMLHQCSTTPSQVDQKSGPPLNKVVRLIDNADSAVEVTPGRRRNK